MPLGKHPKETQPCPDCNAPVSVVDWQKKRSLPQVEQTYECSNCGFEVFVYHERQRGQDVWQFRPVTDGMVANLQFYELAGDWPDAVLDDHFRQGLARYEAIDYYAVEIEGLTQTEWADRRGAAQQSVSENVSKAREKLDE